MKRGASARTPAAARLVLPDFCSAPTVLARARAALKTARKPQPFDRKQALKDLESLLTR